MTTVTTVRILYKDWGSKNAQPIVIHPGCAANSELAVKPALKSAAIFAASALMIAGCSITPQEIFAQRASAPYSTVSNMPYCGAVGSCNVPSREPYPMRGDYGAY